MRTPKDFQENLEKYLSDLDKRIDLEEDVLKLVEGLTDSPDSNIRVKEPIIQTIRAYRNAREYLLDYFPELIK